MNKQITVVVRAPGEKATVRQIEPTLAAMQAIVGGDIECVQQVHGVLNEAGAVLTVLANEEGRQLRLSPNVYVRDDLVIVGSILVVKTTNGEEVGLAGDEIERVKQLVDAYKPARPTDN